MRLLRCQTSLSLRLRLRRFIRRYLNYRSKYRFLKLRHRKKFRHFNFKRKRFKPRVTKLIKQRRAKFFCFYGRSIGLRREIPSKPLYQFYRGKKYKVELDNTTRAQLIRKVNVNSDKQYETRCKYVKRLVKAIKQKRNAWFKENRHKLNFWKRNKSNNWSRNKNKSNNWRNKFNSWNKDKPSNWNRNKFNSWNKSKPKTVNDTHRLLKIFLD